MTRFSFFSLFPSSSPHRYNLAHFCVVALILLHRNSLAYFVYFLVTLSKDDQIILQVLWDFIFSTQHHKIHLLKMSFVAHIHCCQILCCLKVIGETSNYYPSFPRDGHYLSCKTHWSHTEPWNPGTCHSSCWSSCTAISILRHLSSLIFPSPPGEWWQVSFKHSLVPQIFKDTQYKFSSGVRDLETKTKMHYDHLQISLKSWALPCAWKDQEKGEQRNRGEGTTKSRNTLPHVTPRYWCEHAKYWMPAFGNFQNILRIIVLIVLRMVFWPLRAIVKGSLWMLF